MPGRNGRIFIDDVIGGSITHIHTDETIDFELEPFIFSTPDRYALEREFQDVHIDPLTTTLSSEELLRIVNQYQLYSRDYTIDRSNLDAMSYVLNNTPVSYSFEIVGTENDEHIEEEQSDKDIQNDETELNKFLDSFRK